MPDHALQLSQLAADASHEIASLVIGRATRSLARRPGGSHILQGVLCQELSTKKLKLAAVRHLWIRVGALVFEHGHPREARPLFDALYTRLFQVDTPRRLVNKGNVLLWLSRCDGLLGRRATAKRFFMLALCEEARRAGGGLSVQQPVYISGRHDFGMSHQELVSFAFDAACRAAKSSPPIAPFPEAVLQKVSQAWMSEMPAAEELTTETYNPLYLQYLLARLDGDVDGKVLEILVHYLFNNLPGCRASWQRTWSTDYDLLAEFYGPAIDFRRDLGYFIVEAKNWNRPADVGVISKLSHMLEIGRCRFGVLCSDRGLSGAKGLTDGTLEQFTAYHAKNQVIIVISRNDLADVAAGGSFHALLRRRYEEVRLHLLPKRGNPWVVEGRSIH